MIRWGILGAGNIAHRFAKSLAHEPHSKLMAISARNQEKADTFAKAYAVDRVYTSHEDLLADPEVDAIYLALPHQLHCAWSIKALCAKKAVICEKPAVMTAAEMEAVIAAAKENDTLYMEAMKTRFIPLHKKIEEILRSGQLGELQSIDTCLCDQNAYQEFGKTYHTLPESGGCLFDCGIYCVNWLAEFLEEYPVWEKIDGRIEDGINYHTLVRFQAGKIQGSLETAFDRAKPKTMTIKGSKGSLFVEQLHRPEKMTLSLEGQEDENIYIPYEYDDFYSQIAHFAGLLEAGQKESPVMGFGDSLRCVKIMEDIRKVMDDSFI